MLGSLTQDSFMASLLVLLNAASDLQISPATAKSWLAFIERMYIAFPVYPLTKNIARSVIKPVKVYFCDNADIQNDQPARFKNLVAAHLLKCLDFISDYYGYQTQLHYIRDKDGREVDFVTVVDGKVEDLIEVKWRDDEITTALKYSHQRLKPKWSTQIVANLKHRYRRDGITVMSPSQFFKDPPWHEFVSA